MHVWSTCRTCFQLRIYILHPKVHLTSRIAIAVILTNAEVKSTIFQETQCISSNILYEISLLLICAILIWYFIINQLSSLILGKTHHPLHFWDSLKTSYLLPNEVNSKCQIAQFSFQNMLGIFFLEEGTCATSVN